MTTATTTSSGILAAASTTVISNGKFTLNGIICFPGAVAIVYDNTAASGKQMAILDNTGGTVSKELVFHNPVRADIGITVTATGGSVIVFTGA